MIIPEAVIQAATLAQPATLVVVLLWLRKIERMNRALLRLILATSPNVTPELRRFIQEALSSPPAPE